VHLLGGAVIAGTLARFTLALAAISLLKCSPADRHFQGGSA
jgi:hypothetical protein